MTFKVPAGFKETELEIKKSRFIAWAAPVQTREDALAWVEQAKVAFPDARHHCWAYLLASSGAATHAAANDDGEPSGTAGKQILNVIQHKDIANVVVIVIRYFGGIKLGAGGLVRAYAGASEQVLSQLEVNELVATQVRYVRCDFAQEQQIRHFCQQQGVTVVDVTYAEHVTLTLEAPEHVLADLEALAASLQAHVLETSGTSD